MATEKKHRKSNWSHDETMCLVHLYQENANILTAPLSVPGCTSLKKQDVWQRIAASLNTSFPIGKRTTKECQKRWQTILSSAKSRISDFNKSGRGTGGGPAAPPLAEMDLLIRDILSKKYVLSDGIESGELELCSGRSLPSVSNAATCEDAAFVKEEEEVAIPASSQEGEAVADVKAVAETAAPHTQQTVLLVDTQEAAFLAEKRALELAKLRQEIEDGELKMDLTKVLLLAAHQDLELKKIQVQAARHEMDHYLTKRRKLE